MASLRIADRTFASRLLTGTGKYASAAQLRAVLDASGAEVVTMAIKRVRFDAADDGILSALDRSKHLILPNTSGVRTAKEAIFAAELAREALQTSWLKLEIHPDPKYLMPDPVETLEACRELVKKGFTVLPYIHADPVLAKRLEEVGAAAVMPLGAPIGSNRGLLSRDFLRIIIEQARVPVIVDAGLGAPSHAAEVEERDGKYFYDGEEVAREYGKMGKSLKNIVTPDEMYDEYGADTFRLYEMSMGPLDASRPWNTRDVVGMQRFLQRVWRNVVDESTGESKVTDSDCPTELRKLLHRTIDGVRSDMDGLRFNTAIAKLIELNNALTQHVTAHGSTPREAALALTRMLAPLCPHMAEEIWNRLGHVETITYEAFPDADPSMLVDDTMEYPVQINGKVRARIEVATGADLATVESIALADERVVAALAGATPKKVIVVPGRMVNLVL